MTTLENSRPSGLDGGAMPATLSKAAFKMDRAMEFFTTKELSQQIGAPPAEWPKVILKELIDNALDACESAGTPPVVDVQIITETNTLTLTDNGPGLPRETLMGSLDYSIRVSDKAKRVAPSRGALGNALKCLWAAPFVLDGHQGQVAVDTPEGHFEITVTLDEIAQRPILAVVETEPTVTSGTKIEVKWPGLSSYIDEDGNGSFYREAENLLTKFALFNPHAFFNLNGREISSEYVTPFQSPKWTPTDKPDGAWYTTTTLSELIAAHITAGDGAVPIREFLAEFAGLSGTKVRAKALEALGMTGKTLNDLVIDGKMNQSKVRLIQAAMTMFSKRVKPDRLGVIGQDHFLRGNECSKYKCIKGEGDKDGKLPFVVEVSVGVFPDFDDRTVWVGLNFSPIEGVPFDVIHAALDKAMVGECDPVAVLIHLTTPRVNFTDRAKRHAVLPDEVNEAIHSAIVSAASEWTTKVKHKNRGERVSQRELKGMYRPKVKPVTVKDAAYKVMTQAYLKASDNGALPANARQIMYAARPLIIELVGKPDIWTTSARFTQGLLPDFISENPELTKDWDVVFDDRGHMHEPHTGRSLGIGTLAVRSYINGWHKPVVDKSLFIKLDRSTQTKGPSGRFNGVLFLEKEGFNPLLERAGIAERFDIGIMSTKGHSTTAARLLVESLSDEGIPIFVAHDFDKSGYGILQGLRESNRRWKWKSTPKVIDFGLNLADAMEMGLESEDVGFKDDKDPRILMREYGLPEDEVNFLCSHGRPGDWVGHRIELNAIPSGQFITWLEGKLIGAGVQKVIPSESILNDAFTRFVQIGRAEKEMGRILAKLPEVSHTGNILKSVRDLLANNPLMPWDEAVAQLAGDAV